MNSETMFSAISDIADEFITEAEYLDRLALVNNKRRRLYRIATGAATCAACVALAIGLGVGLSSTAPFVPGDTGNNSGNTPPGGADMKPPPGIGTIGSLLNNGYGNVLLKSVGDDRFTFVVDISRSSDSFVWEYEIRGNKADGANRFIVATSDPRQSGIVFIPADEVLRVFVNGEESEDCMLPQTTGEYEVVVDYSRLSELYGRVSLIGMTVGGLEFSLTA